MEIVDFQVPQRSLHVVNEQRSKSMVYAQQNRQQTLVEFEDIL